MSGRLGDRTVTIMVSEDNRAVAAALASVQTEPAPGEVFDLHHIFVSPTPPLPLTEAARAARAKLAGSAPKPSRWVPSLVVMLPGYECLLVGPRRDDAGILGELAAAACAWADQHDLRTVAFLYTRPGDVGLAAALADRGFTGVPLSITWDLPVPAGGLDAYFEALPAKRRREARRELSRLDQSGVRLGELDQVALTSGAALDQLTALRCQLAAKYGRHPDQRSERARLERLISDVGAGQARTVAAMAGEEMIGFALFCPYGSTWHCLAVGFDYADPRSRLCYFGAAFYGAVPVAAAAGARWLSYGQGAAQAKRARGCVGTPLTCWVRTTDPDLSAAVLASADVTELEGLPG
jgi:predicted N-acyltransferase